MPLTNRAPLWKPFFPLVFILVSTDGFFSLWLYPLPLPLLVKDIVIVFSFVMLLLRENMFDLFREIRNELGDAVVLASGFFVTVIIAQVFNPAAPNLLIGLLGIKTYLLPWVLLPMGYAYIKSEDDVRKFLKFFVILSVFVNAVGLYQHLMGPEIMIQYFGPGFAKAFKHAAIGTTDRSIESFYRVIGTLASTGQYGNFLCYSIVVCFGLIFMTKYSKQRIIWIFCQVLNLLALFVTGSRGSLLFSALMLLYFVFLVRKIRGALPVLIGTLIIGAVGLGWLGKGVTARVKTLKDVGMIQQRTIGFTGNIFLRYLDLYPMGRGTGAASTASRYVSGPATKRGRDWILVENFPSKLQAELGLVGVVAFFIFLFALIARWLGNWLRRFSPEKLPEAATLTTYCVASLIFLSLFGILDTPPGYYFLWGSIGMMLKLVVLSNPYNNYNY